MNSIRNKTLLLIGALTLIFILLAGGVFVAARIYQDAQNRRLEPAPTPFLTPAPNDLLIVQSAPRDGATRVSRDQPIRIEFNRVPDESEFIFLLSPETANTKVLEGTVLTISPETQWDEGMPYRYVIRYPDPGRSSQGFDFVTIGKSSDVIPDTQPDPTYIVGQNQYELENFPDTYVANRTPFESEYFSVESEFRRGTPQGHSYFIVEGKQGYSESEVKEAFAEWLRSIGLSSEQIAGLDVEYLL